MMLDNRYKIEVVVIELVQNGKFGSTAGACYNNFAEFRKECPESGWQFGYVVIDTETGYVADGCDEWNDSVDEAILDWKEHCEKDGDFMNKEQFYDYILDNFDLNGTSQRLIRNVLNFVEENYTEENEQYQTLCELLDNTIGLTDEEIRKVYM